MIIIYGDRRYFNIKGNYNHDKTYWPTFIIIDINDIKLKFITFQTFSFQMLYQLPLMGVSNFDPDHIVCNRKFKPQ